jgi:hypothetical protein
LRSDDDQAAVGVTLDEVERADQVAIENGAVAWSTSGVATPTPRRPLRVASADSDRDHGVAAKEVPDASGDHGRIALGEAARPEYHHLLVEPRGIGEHRR